jgi:hypothetical protein
VHELGHGVVVVVADGAGGTSGGAEAADIVVAMAESALADPAFEPWRAASWVALLARADRVVADDPWPARRRPPRQPLRAERGGGGGPSAGPYRPGAVVYIGGNWYRIDPSGRATPEGMLPDQPPPARERLFTELLEGK